MKHSWIKEARRIKKIGVAAWLMEVNEIFEGGRKQNGIHSDDNKRGGQQD